MSDHIETAAYNLEDGVGWHGIGFGLTEVESRDPKLIAKKLKLDWEVEAHPVFIKKKNGQYIQVPNSAAQVRTDNWEALSITSANRYHTVNRQPCDVLEAFRDDFRREKMRMSHAASLMGGRIIVCSALMTPDYDIVLGKGKNIDRVQSFITLSTGYDKAHGTKATKGTIRVVCWNTLMAATNEAMRTGRLRSIKASTELEYASLRDLITHVKELYEVERERYTELANARMSDAQVLRYFADVLEIRISDLGKTDKNNVKLVSTKSQNMLADIKNAYQSGRGALLAQGTYWGALNAVTHYATHDKTVRDTSGDGTESARITSNLFGDANKLKVRALRLALQGTGQLPMAA